MWGNFGIMLPMSVNAKIAEFISFCIEMYAREKKLSGREVSSRLRAADGYEYLLRGYDVLHTMGHEWLIEDLDELFRVRGVAA